MNQPPVILSPASSEGNELVLVGDVAKPRVVARDPDGDLLHFEWLVPGDFLEDVDDVALDDGVQASTATIRRDKRLDDQKIRCVVTDYVNAGQQVTWTVEVWE